MSGNGKRLIASKEVRQWFAVAEGECAKEHDLFSLFPTGKVGVFIEVYFARDNRDIDGVTKKTLDALTLHAYHDDKQVKCLVSGVDEYLWPEDPHVLVYVWEKGRCPDWIREKVNQLL